MGKKKTCSWRLGIRQLDVDELVDDAMTLRRLEMVLPFALCCFARHVSCSVLSHVKYVALILCAKISWLCRRAQTQTRVQLVHYGHRYGTSGVLGDAGEERQGSPGGGSRG